MDDPKPPTTPAEPAPGSTPAPGPADPPAKAPRIPPSDPGVHDTKRFMVGGVQLAVTLAGGRVGTRFAPADLAAKATDRIGALIKDLAGGFDPAFLGALGGGSMTLLFGDPELEEMQSQFPIEFVLPQALRVADVIELEDDELFAQAMALGKPASRYSELAQFVQTEALTLTWHPRDAPPRILTPDRAQRQHTRLSAQGDVVARPITVNGVLYRAIAEPNERRLGTVGIRLHTWSATPPRVKRGGRLRAVAYEDRAIEDKIKGGLFGEPVEVHLEIRHARPGTSLDFEAYDMVVTDINSGPPEGAVLGNKLMLDDEDDDEMTRELDDDDELIGFGGKPKDVPPAPPRPTEGNGGPGGPPPQPPGTDNDDDLPRDRNTEDDSE